MRKKEIIEKDGIQYEVIKIIKEESKGKVIIGPGWDVTEYEKWYDEKFCLEAVKRNGYLLQYVKDQTEAVCLEAVKSDGDSLRYVKDQTEAVCLEAVKYVKDQTEAVCLEAVKSDGDSLQYVNKKVFINKNKKKQEKI